MDEELYNYLISEDVEEPENEDLDAFLEHANLNSVLNEAIDPTIKSKVQGAASQAAQGASNAVQGAAKAVKDNVAAAASAISSKAEEYLGKIGGFVTKELTNINGALEKASQKVNENPDVKLVGDIATNTIEILKVPSLVFKAGDKLPSVRDFATTFKVNPNTMQKALTELEDMNLIYTERTNGKYVTNDAKLIESLKDEYAITLAKSYFQGMRRIGLGKADSIKYLEGIDE